jgi:hypothetical protein
VNDKADRAQTALAIRLRQLLLEVARREETLALSEAAGARHWAPHPASVIADGAPTLVGTFGPATVDPW